MLYIDRWTYREGPVSNTVLSSKLIKDNELAGIITAFSIFDPSLFFISFKKLTQVER